MLGSDVQEDRAWRGLGLTSEQLGWQPEWGSDESPTLPRVTLFCPWELLHWAFPSDRGSGPSQN